MTSMVRDEVDKVLSASPRIIREYTSHLSKSTGKYIRGVSLLTCAIDKDGVIHKDAIRFATAIEFIHLATLVHDDVIDNAELRRGELSLQKKYGCTATFFVRKGEEFIRISTDVMLDGHRALGTDLDPNGPAIIAIRKGEPFYGNVDILGKPYETGYEPIKNSSGEIIGAYYVGYQVEN